MKRFLFLFLMVLLATTIHAAEGPRTPLGHDTTEQGKKVALVIGNSAYQHAKALPNPVNDAIAIAAALERMSFDVILVKDATRSSLKDAIKRLRRQAAGAEKALFFYAGHGLEVDGTNYLVPVDAPQLTDKRDLKDTMILVADVLDEIEPARAKVVFLDACRNNPLSRSLAEGRSASVGRGLAPMDAPRGTLIAYATKHGAIADDGDGKHSPYTQALLENLEKPGLELRQILDQTRAKVLVATRDKQLPYEYSSLTGAFYFIQGSLTVNVQSAPQQFDPAATELSFWDTIKSGNSREDFEEYLRVYPKGKFAGLARIRLKGMTVAAVPAVVPTVSPVVQAPAQAVLVVAPAPAVTSTTLSNITPGKVFKDCADCPEMVVIPAGRFQMGGDKFDDEKPVHSVTIGKAFALGKTEVTQLQWRAVMGNNPSSFKQCGGDCPVENVRWNDAQAFIEKLNAKTGQRYRLPSEAEWEYACRAGGNHTYCGGNDINAVAWHGSNSGSTTHPVAGKQANAWGLYDMSGNVWEWVEDCAHDDYNSAPSDGSAWTSGNCSERRLRGGSWLNNSDYARSALRVKNDTLNRYAFIGGFRLARMLAAPAVVTQALAIPQKPVAVSNLTRDQDGGLTQALRCMDDLFFNSNYKTKLITSAGIPDETGKVRVGTKETLITAVTKMSSKSGAFEFINFNSDGKFVTEVERVVKLPDYYIRGGFEYLDPKTVLPEYLPDLKNIQSNFPEYDLVSVINLKTAVGDAASHKIIPKSDSSNSLIILKSDHSDSKVGKIFKAGKWFTFSLNQSRGSLDQEERLLLDLNVIETLGRFASVPYWKCLGIDANYQGTE